MPKMKTKRAAAKRFKVTKNGKVKYNRMFRRHILEKKSKKRKRQLRGGGILSEADTKNILALIPYK